MVTLLLAVICCLLVQVQSMGPSLSGIFEACPRFPSRRWRWLLVEPKQDDGPKIRNMVLTDFQYASLQHAYDHDFAVQTQTLVKNRQSAIVPFSEESTEFLPTWERACRCVGGETITLMVVSVAVTYENLDWCQEMDAALLKGYSPLPHVHLGKILIEFGAPYQMKGGNEDSLPFEINKQLGMFKRTSHRLFKA